MAPKNLGYLQCGHTCNVACKKKATGKLARRAYVNPYWLKDGDSMKHHCKSITVHPNCSPNCPGWYWVRGEWQEAELRRHQRDKDFQKKAAEIRAQAEQGSDPGWAYCGVEVKANELVKTLSMSELNTLLSSLQTRGRAQERPAKELAASIAAMTDDERKAAEARDGDGTKVEPDPNPKVQEKEDVAMETDELASDEGGEGPTEKEKGKGKGKEEEVKDKGKGKGKGRGKDRAEARGDHQGPSAATSVPPPLHRRQTQSPSPASHVFYENLQRKVKVVVVVDDFLSAPHDKHDEHQAAPRDIFQEGESGATLTHWAYDWISREEYALLKRTFPGQIFRADKEVKADGDVAVYFVEWLALTIGFLHNHMVDLRFLPYDDYVKAVTGRDLTMRS